jgi:uncharacterized membrane protein
MRTAWIIAGVYTLVLSIFAVHRWHILTFDADTGEFAQMILNAGHGFADAPEGGSHFQFHFSPIIALLYPLVALTHTALVLQFAQIVLIALTAPATYALFRPYASAGLSTCLGALALLYAPLAAVGETEFHELAFFPILLIMMLWAADRDRWGWFALFGIGCLLTKEDVGIELAFVGIAVAAFIWLRRRRTSGEGLLLGEPHSPTASAAAFASLSFASVFVVLSYFYIEHRVFGTFVPDLATGTQLQGAGWETGQNYYYPFAHGALALIAALFTRPLIAIPGIYNYNKLAYIAEAVIPLMLLPLRSLWSLAAVPAFVILLLASNPYQWNMGRHYSAMWAPWLIVATGVALVCMERTQGIQRARRWAYAALIGCALVLSVANPMHLGYYLRPMYSDVASAQAALACVPRGASVSTHKEWYSVVAALNPQSTFNEADGVDYLVYAADYYDFFRRWTMPKLAQSLRAGRYVEICHFGNVVTYRRR